MTFNEARYSSRMTLSEIANLFKLSLQTVTKYKKQNKAPEMAIVSLMAIGGHIPSFKQKNDFTGWSFGQGYLWSPAGERFTSGDILAIRIDRELIRSQRVEIKQLKSRALMKESAQIIPFPIKRKN